MMLMKGRDGDARIKKKASKLRKILYHQYLLPDADYYCRAWLMSSKQATAFGGFDLTTVTFKNGTFSFNRHIIFAKQRRFVIL